MNSFFFFIILFFSLIVGLLPSTVMHRTRFGLISDIAVSIVGVFVGGLARIARYHSGDDRFAAEQTTRKHRRRLGTRLWRRFVHFLSQPFIARARKSAIRSLRRRAAIICPRAFLHSGKQFQTRRHQPGRRARHGAIHAGDPRRYFFFLSVRSAASDTGVCCAICIRSSAIFCSPPLPTMRAPRSTSRIGSPTRASCRQETQGFFKAITARPVQTGLRQPGGEAARDRRPARRSLACSPGMDRSRSLCVKPGIGSGL